jgi:hypothetical protein
VNSGDGTKFRFKNSRILTHTVKCLALDTDGYLTIITNEDSEIDLNQPYEHREVECLTYVQISDSNRADFNTVRQYEEKIVELTEEGYILCPSTTDSGVNLRPTVDSFSIEQVPALSSSDEPACNDRRFPNGINLRVRNTRV